MFKHIVNRPYYEALKKLRDKKTRNLQETSRLFGMDGGRVSTLVRSWQQEELIERERDTRELKIKISELGLNVINKLEEAEKTFNKEPHGKSPINTMEEKYNVTSNTETNNPTNKIDSNEEKINQINKPEKNKNE